MPKKKSSLKKAAAPLTLEVFTKILERTTDTLEQRVVGRLTSNLATKEGLKVLKEALETKLDRKPDIEEVERIVNLEMNKAAEVINTQFKERDERLQDHEGRIKKLETAVT